MPILGYVPVYLLLGFLLWKLKIGPEEVLSVYPGTWNPIYSDIIDQKQVWSYDCSTFLLCLFPE